jgi:hypothetical protein
MPTMDDHLTALENFRDLEPYIIRITKVAKLLKLILKLTTIPRDDEFKFKERCGKLLAGWNAIIAADDVKRDDEPDANGVTLEKSVVERKEPVTNGNSKPDETTEKPIEPEPTAVTEEAEKEEPTAVPAAA